MHVETSPDHNHKSAISSNLWLWGGAIVLAIILGGAWILFSRTTTLSGGSGAEAGSLEPAPIAGHPAPPFELQGLYGESINLADYRGQPVIINFWATWCGPCRAEMPDLQEVSVDHADELVIIGVNNTASDNHALVAEFVDEFALTFPIALDPEGTVVEDYQVIGLPMTIFVDRDGVIQEVFTGPVNKAYIESKLPEL